MSDLDDQPGDFGARYRIERELAAGGMGKVYLALDLRHHRRVAIKVLRPEVGTLLGGDRFLREIEITAGLQHPNILPLYDSGLTGASPYYVMPFVTGESLRERIAREPQLPLETALGIARGVAQALSFAHQRGIVHRDIKPENILLHEGQPLVADFGIARALAATGGSRVTETGLVLGTPRYMSPEQALGQAIDLRTDVYALTCLVYEMLSGQPPFTGSTAQDVVRRQLTEKVRPLLTIRPALPPRLDQVLARGLAASPADRYESASALIEALDAAIRGGATPGRARRRWPALAAVIVLGLAAVGWALRRHPAEAVPPAVIAVLPFVNASADSAEDYFAEGIAEELINGLSRVAGLRVVPRSSSFALRSLAGGVRAIGARLGAASVLEGTVRKAGARLRVTAQLTTVADGYAIWTDSFDRPVGDALSIEEDLARAILAKLAPTLSTAGVEPLLRRGTLDATAYDLYLQGRYYFDLRTGAGFARAGDAFERALARDSTFARAWAGLADSYCILANFGIRPAREVCPRSIEAARRALALDSTLAEAHASIGFVQLFYEWDPDLAEKSFRRALTLDPLYATAYLWLMQAQSARGDTAAALATIQRALALEPYSALLRTRLGTALLRAGRVDEAIAEDRQTLALDSTYSEGWRSLALLYVIAGAADSGAAILRAHQGPIGLLAYAAAKAGRREETHRLLTTLRADPVASRAQSLYAAFATAALREDDQALAWFRRAVEERTPDVVFAWTDPYLAPLRANPTFAKLAAVARIPRPPTAPER